MYAFVIFGSSAHGFLSVQYTQTTFPTQHLDTQSIPCCRTVYEVMVWNRVMRQGIWMWCIAGFPRVATSPEVAPRLVTAKFGNCGVTSPVLSGSGRFVTRDESGQLAQKSRQSCRVRNVDHPHQATLVSHTCYISLTRQRKAR